MAITLHAILWVQRGLTQEGVNNSVFVKLFWYMRRFVEVKNLMAYGYDLKIQNIVHTSF